MNNFPADLSYSLDKTDDTFVDEVYKKAFPHLKEIRVVTDLETQKKGIDKILVFEGGNTVFVDEKRRRKDYGDILLEEYSNWERKTVGWLGKTKYTDYIAYIVAESKKIYLLPFLLLQKCWVDNYSQWLTEYGRKFADNSIYHTSNIAIPTDILIDMLKKSMTISHA